MEASSRPPSRGVSPIQFEDCIKSLLKLTLLSSIQGKLQTGLSNDYCSTLLKHQPIDVPEGMPAYSLFEQMASSLCGYISSATAGKSDDEPLELQKDTCKKQKEDEWKKWIVEMGSLLSSMLKEVDFELHVQEPFLTQLHDGLKTIEGRCAVADYNRIKSGDLLLFNKCVMLQVQDVHLYASFHEMLDGENLEKALPGVKNIEEGVQIYRNFYSEEKERSNGVLAIAVERPTREPLDLMASLLSKLSYEGVGWLMDSV